MNCDLSILPLKPMDIKDDSDKKYHPHLPSIARNHGTCMLILGAVASGKTCLLVNLLLSKHFFRDAFEKVYVFSPTAEIDDSMRHMKEAFEVYSEYKDEILEKIIAQQKKYPKDKMPKIAIVADDSMGLLTKKFYSFISRYRHINSNVFLSIQNFRALNPIARTNANAICIMNGIYNDNELAKIDEEYGSIYKNTLLYCYRKYAKQRYSFLYLKLRKNPPEMYLNFTEKIKWNMLKKKAKQWNKTHLDSDTEDEDDDLE